MEWAVPAVLFLGALVRSTLGFGEALVAVPLLALLMPVEQAAPVAVLVSITVSAVVLLQDWREVHFASAWRLVVATLAGIPVGLWMLRTLPEAVVKAGLGLLILAFSVRALRGGTGQRLGDDRWAWVFGFQAGVLGGAYGMNGPPLAIYGAWRGWAPAQFRATLQAYFLPAGVAGMVGYWAAGLWTPLVTHSFLVSLPGVLVAVVLGRVAHSAIRAERFRGIVYGGLAVIGVVLVLQSLLPKT